jgi:hypothetical protein
MPRYIDADRVMEEIASMSSHNLCEWSTLGVKALINRQPTADVAPRAEVVNKICCEIEEEIVAALESNYRALKEWDDGRCNDYVLEIVNRIKGKIDALRGIEGFVEELKKKYTDATDTNVGNK